MHGNTQGHEHIFRVVPDHFQIQRCSSFSRWMASLENVYDDETFVSLYYAIPCYTVNKDQHTNCKV